VVVQIVTVISTWLGERDQEKSLSWDRDFPSRDLLFGDGLILLIEATIGKQY